MDEKPNERNTQECPEQQLARRERFAHLKES
jgi:hypothetical protein